MINSLKTISVCFFSAACITAPDTASIARGEGGQPAAPAHCSSSAIPLSISNWPGPPSERVKSLVGTANQSLREAFSAKNTDRIYEIVTDLEHRLGEKAGVPETRPDYHENIDREHPDLAALMRVWMRTRDIISSQQPFLASVHQQHIVRQSLPRLRVSQRYGRSLLLLSDRGIDKERHLSEAIAVYDFLVSQQSDTGVFGFPYAPASRNRLARQAVEWADEAERAGVNVVHGNYIVVDPTSNGALQYDNGVVGADLVYLYWLTGERKYLESAVRAGDWALTQPVSTNWNYNSFAVLLLSRLYRATGEERFLHGAREFAELGVLPGQMSNGRWVDPHNARIQYHSVMLIGLIEYELALEQASMPRARRVGEAVVLGLDNLAAQINCHGPSNAHEAHALEALALGTMKYGQNALWSNAMSISVNFFTEHYGDELAKAKHPPPNSMMTYALLRAVADRGEPSAELRGSVQNAG